MNKAFFILLFFLHVSLCRAQTNLVPNPSFEFHTACPTGSDIYKAAPWFSANIGTPDYYHVCGNISMNVPNTWLGYQQPRTGDAFAGEYFGPLNFNMNANGREYMETPLLAPLIAGRRYCAEFYVNFNNKSWQAIDGFGMYFSNDTLLNDTTVYYFGVIPQVENPSGNIISDTLSWVKVSGSFIAQGGENFLTIGNFRSDANTQVDTVPGFAANVYYFIDDVAVYLCDTIDTVSSSSIEIPNVFTPNGDGINDAFQIKFSGMESISYSIYDRWGILIFESNRIGDTWDAHTTSGQDASEGVYYFVLTAKDVEDKEYRKTGFIHLLR